MEDVQKNLQRFLDACRSIFKKHRAPDSKVVPFPGSPEVVEGTPSLLREAIREVEHTDEFEAFANTLASGVLTKDLDRLCEVEKERRRKKEKKLKKAKKRSDSFDVEVWRRKLASHMTQRFLRNSGTYLRVWEDEEFDESHLIDELEMQTRGVEPEYLHLYVFDSLALYDDKKRLQQIKLPVGEVKVYDEKELRTLFRLPQSALHDGIKPKLHQRVAGLHVLTLLETEPYRGRGGTWLNDLMIDPLEWFGRGRKETEIELIGPIFLCLGDAANLAEEILIRTNVFDTVPVGRIERNGYLPGRFNEEGELVESLTVKEIGKDGLILRNIYDAWLRVNGLASGGLLRWPTETYARAVMKRHWPPTNDMEVFVYLITVVESLLTPESSTTELAYKIALRGAALLAHDFEGRTRAQKKLKRFYKIRSKIVHEGHAGKANLNAMIGVNLMEIARESLLRYCALMSPAMREELQEWGLPNAKILEKNSKRPEAISAILDTAVMDPKVIIRVEQELRKWGLPERRRWWLDF